jgi:L-fuculose-phosphate aldolase/L-ribulose-5-phosphate 4-epimerase
MHSEGDMPADLVDQVKQELVKCARRAYEIGLQTGNGGNLSSRIAGTDRVVIKGSGQSFGECTLENLVTVRLHGQLIDGEGPPSRELMTHLAIYNARPDVMGVFHCHAPWSIACAEFAADIPCVSLHAEAKVGRIPVLRVAGHADRAVTEAVQALLVQHPGLKVFVQAKHGIFSLAGSIRLAEHNAELVEETAKIAWLVALHRQQEPG